MEEETEEEEAEAPAEAPVEVEEEVVTTTTTTTGTTDAAVEGAEEEGVAEEADGEGEGARLLHLLTLPSISLRTSLKPLLCLLISASPWRVAVTVSLTGYTPRSTPARKGWTF